MHRLQAGHIIGPRGRGKRRQGQTNGKSGGQKFVKLDHGKASFEIFSAIMIIAINVI
jgi:hypothetical protein